MVQPLQQEAALKSKRMKKKAYYDLINSISSKLEGARLFWEFKSLCYIDRPNKFAIYWKTHGNKYSVWIEFMSYDREALEWICQQFPEVFSKVNEMI